MSTVMAVFDKKLHIYLFWGKSYHWSEIV